MKSEFKNVLYIEANLDGTVGGSHHCLFEIVKYIDRNKYMPSVLFFQDNALVQDFQNICNVYILKQGNGLVIQRDFPQIYEIASRRLILIKIILFYQRIHNFFRYFIPNFIRSFLLVKKHGFDLIHANNSPDLSDWLILSKVFKIKMVSHLRGPWYPNKTRKILLSYYDKVISISNWVTEQIRKQGISCNNFVTIYDGIDLNYAQYDNKKDLIFKEWNIPLEAPVIGIVGNIRRWKGQHVAIESLHIIVEKYKDIKCIFVGEISNSEKDMEYLNHLRQLVSKHDLEKNVVFAGFRKDIHNIINCLDILVHTSVLPEPLGRVILEGMIFRKPVIATNHGGPVEIIEDGISGFLIPPENPKCLADKITYLLENKQLTHLVGKNARKRVLDMFSIEKNVIHIEEVYNKMLF